MIITVVEMATMLHSEIVSFALTKTLIRMRNKKRVFYNRAIEIYELCFSFEKSCLCFKNGCDKELFVLPLEPN